MQKYKNLGVKDEDYNRFQEVKELTEDLSSDLFTVILNFYIKHNKEDLRAKFEKKFENIVK